MIDEDKTFDKYGYRSTDLSKGSHKHVVMICDFCGEEFIRIKKESGGKRYCSRDCMGKYSSENYSGEKSKSYGKYVGENSHFWAGGGVLKICGQCGKEYLVKRSQVEVNRFCSRECMGKYKSENYSGENSSCWKQKIVKICEQCGGEYEIGECVADNSRFCSRECMDSWRSKSIRGQGNPNWNDGISFLPYCPKFDEKFKEKIRNDFGRACFVCGKTEIDNKRKLSVHHTTYDKSAMCGDSESSFVPLCDRCHSKTNFNRHFWERTITYALRYYGDYYSVGIQKPLLLLQT